MGEKTVILFFRRAESNEQAQKCFKSEIVSYFNCRTRKLLSRSGLPVIEQVDFPKNGLSVQERYYQAVKNAFNQGFENVISVGNDCPQLKLSDIIQADRQLQNHDLVIGPDLRGGAYLVGISRRSFSREWALSLPWHTRGFNIAAAKGFEYVAFLETLSDFNAPTEIKWLKKSYVRKHLLQPLLQLITNAHQFIFSENETSCFVLGYKQLRAPPLINS